ncbi:MAG: hypothetical protein U5Q44_16470 [Dehalococcoidia bacterium]|nr:hypothetical protein [Dehalococcoidia bacterium]
MRCPFDGIDACCPQHVARRARSIRRSTDAHRVDAPRQAERFRRALNWFRGFQHAGDRIRLAAYLGRHPVVF